MATPAEMEKLSDQVLNKIGMADKLSRAEGTAYGFTGTADATKIFNKLLQDHGAPPNSTGAIAVGPSKKDGNVMFSLAVPPEKRAEVEAIIKKMGGEFFPDSEQRPRFAGDTEFTNDVRMPKAAFDKAMEKTFAIPADSNPIPTPTQSKKVKAGVGQTPLFPGK